MLPSTLPIRLDLDLLVSVKLLYFLILNTFVNTYQSFKVIDENNAHYLHSFGKTKTSTNEAFLFLSMNKKSISYVTYNIRNPALPVMPTQNQKFLCYLGNKWNPRHYRYPWSLFSSPANQNPIFFFSFLNFQYVRFSRTWSLKITDKLLTIKIGTQ